jgi:dienelactone hydrolase
MGFSGGASAARYAAMQRFAPARAAPGQRFAAFVLVYPSCSASPREDAQLLKAAVRVHHGDADLITSLDPCRDWVARARTAGADIELRIHPGAGHGFDMPDGIPPVMRPDMLNFSRCRFAETDDGELVNADTGQPLEEGDKCIGKGVGGGPHRAARVAATAEVTEFLVEVLKPR